MEVPHSQRLLCICVVAFAASVSALARGDDSWNCRRSWTAPIQERIDACTLVIAAQPRASWAFLRRGDAYSQSGDQDRALSDFRRAINIDPENAAANLRR